MRTLSALLDNTIKLPSLPDVAIKLLQIMKKENLTLNELSGVISYDPALATKILSISNSSFYTLPYKVDTIDRAVSVLGVDVLKNITLSFALIKGMRKDKTEGFDHEFFWRRSITSAVSAEMLASKFGETIHEAFVTALLMDIGILIMYLSSPDDYLRVLDEKRISRSPIDEIEKKVFGLDHQTVGCEFIKKWGIPESIYSPIAYHHKHDKAPEGIQNIANILMLSDLTSSVYHGSRNIEKLNLLRTTLEEKIQISGEDFDAFVDSVAEKTVEVLSFFEIGHESMKPYSQVLQEANEELEKLNISYEYVIIELNQAKRRAESFAHELKEANEKLRELAYRDGLTGLYNHRYFHEMMETEMQRARRYEYNLSLVMLDIDNFKAINDTYGHPQGDEVLRSVSKVLKQSIRTCDVLSRYGGEEFTIILPETDIKGAAILAERVRQMVEKSKISFNGDSVKVTVSIGAATFDPQKTTKDKAVLIGAADKALYNAKVMGKNRIGVSSLAL